MATEPVTAPPPVSEMVATTTQSGAPQVTALRLSTDSFTATCTAISADIPTMPGSALA